MESENVVEQMMCLHTNRVKRLNLLTVVRFFDGQRRSDPMRSFYTTTPPHDPVVRTAGLTNNKVLLCTKKETTQRRRHSYWLRYCTAVPRVYLKSEAESILVILL